MKIIDAHIHIWQNGSPRKAHRQTPYSALEVLKDMDLAGVSAAIIQPPAWPLAPLAQPFLHLHPLSRPLQLA